MRLRLNEKNIFVSTGSACTSQNLEPSHVLTATGLPHELAHGSIRFTLGKTTTKQQLDSVAKELKKTIELYLMKYLGKDYNSDYFGELHGEIEKVLEKYQCEPNLF